MTDRVFSRAFHAADGAEAWRVLPEGVSAYFRTDSFAVEEGFWKLADPTGNEVDIATTSAPKDE